MSIPVPSGYTLYAGSIIEMDGTRYAMLKGIRGKELAVAGLHSGFLGVEKEGLLVCPLNPENASELRRRIPSLRPQPLGLKKSVGCGDRLGLATPGHLLAVRNATGVAPIVAQQSMRENARTGRSPQDVMDDAMWGVFQEGWYEPWGADADHLKNTEDIDVCVAAGYTFFTVDPGDHVDNDAQSDSLEVLETKLNSLPWNSLSDSLTSLEDRYLDQRFVVEDLRLSFDRPVLARAAAKYGAAIAHSASMYRHLARAAGVRTFELEVSVDETETPTSPQEHFFIANELKRLGVQWVSLAPRYIGQFEKGVDYIGDLDTFDVELAKHAAIARVLGPYKLSIHSGSDKFSVYPSFARRAGDLVHLKTAGTSYLEALRAISQVEPAFFREILNLARECYDEDRATYHVSADVRKVPDPKNVMDDDLERILDTFDGREVLHVTFGSVLDRFSDRLRAVLDANEVVHYDVLASHFRRHLAPFMK